MELYINEDIKCSASACSYNHKCLGWEKEKFCQVTSTINDNMIYINCQYDKDCNYKHNINDRILCTCPVRLEIYRKYNI